MSLKFSFRLFAFSFAAFFISACEVEKKPSDNVSADNRDADTAVAVRGSGEGAGKKYPVDVLRDINLLADKYLKNASPIAKKAWIDRQLASYDAINSIVPDVSVQTFDAIKTAALADNKGNWIDAHKQILAQLAAVENLTAMKKSVPPAQFDFAERVVKSLYPSNFAVQANEIQKWCSFYNTIGSADVFSPAEVEALKERVISEIAGQGNVAASQWFGRQVLAKRRLAALIAKADETAAARISEIAVENPADFEKQYALVSEVSRSAAAGANVAGKGAKAAEEASENAQIRKSLDKSRFSIFTTRGLDGRMTTAVLVKLHGKPVVLCNKDFFDGKLPFRISNSVGEFTCSRAYISRDYPLIMLMPDSLPKEFVPFEVVSAEEMPSLIDKRIFMFAPAGAGLTRTFVRIFSEDQKYLNLTSDTAPRITKDRDVKRLDRNGDKLLLTTTISVDVGANSIVIDPDTKKVVSMAFRKYNPGVLSWTGKTGSVVGHENMLIPDTDTFVRQFDGTVKAAETPDSSIQFIRMTALDNWTIFDSKTAASQKTLLRKFTDDNNDFLMFFKRNLFGDMLRSRTLGQVAEKYRRSLLNERMDRNMYERIYRRYMLDVLYAIRRELSRYPNCDAFYPIYRDEMEYQVALRKAMSDYLADIVKRADITNCLHFDLRTRYSDPMVVPQGQMLPTDVGGSIGGGF